MSKAFSIKSAALLIGFSFTALSVAHAETITFGTDVDAGTLDPRLARDTTAYRVADLIYSGLVHLTPGLEVKPDLGLCCTDRLVDVLSPPQAIA
jgi:peptide/nickel transport system substrate-binding protein